MVNLTYFKLLINYAIYYKYMSTNKNKNRKRKKAKFASQLCHPYLCGSIIQIHFPDYKVIQIIEKVIDQN